MRELTLASDGLLSKWGFNDGDEPDELLALLDDVGILGGYNYRLPDKVWHNVLCRLVREQLIPRLDQDVTVYALETNHNPIRARTVDGINVAWPLSPQPDLTPESVAIPIDVVLAAIDDEMRSAVTCDKSPTPIAGRQGS